MGRFATIIASGVPYLFVFPLFRRDSVHELTPTPNPSPQGGGGLSGIAHPRKFATILAPETANRFPSPLWGGVRGGGIGEGRHAILLCAALLAALALGACRESGKADDYFAISGRLFEFNYRMAVATYVVTLNPLKPMQEGQVAVVSFENPAGGDPIVVRQKIWPKLPHVTLESPPLTCVVKGKPYAVAIRIEDAAGNVLQTLDTSITSSLDESILPDRPLVIGPEYELNPDLKGHPNGKLPGEPKPKCPAGS